jgi:hypothetical protein
MHIKLTNAYAVNNKRGPIRHNGAKKKVAVET